MSRGKELVKNTAIVAIGKVSTKFLSFFLLPFYTAVLSTEEYGIVDLLGTYTSLLLPLIVFQIEDAVFRFLVDVRGKEFEKRTVISTTAFFCLFQSVIFSIIFFLLMHVIPINYKGYLWLNVIVSIFSGVMLQLTRGLGDNQSYAFSSFLIAVLAIFLNLIFVLGFHLGAEGLLLSSLIANVSGILYLGIKKRIYQDIKIRWFRKKLLKEMISYSIPLVPNYLSWWVVGASDKSVVNYFLGVSQNGILSVSQKFSTAYTNFYSIFNLAWTEHASVHQKDEDCETYYSYVIETSFRVLSCACMGMIALVALAFPYLIHKKFASAYYQIPIYMLSSFLYSVIGIYSVVYIALKKTGDIAKTSFLAAVINLTMNIGLVQHIGLYASSISSVVAYGVMLAIRYVDIKKYMQIRIKKTMVIAVLIGMIVTFYVYYLQNTWISMLHLIGVILFTIYLNRKILKEFIKTIKQRIGK